MAAIDLNDFEPVVRSQALYWRRIAFGVSGDWDLADDAVQIVLIRLYRHWSRIERATLNAYVRKAVLRAALDELKRVDRRHEVSVSHDRLPDLASSAPSTPDSTTSSHLRQALRGLPKAQRCVLALRYYGDCTVEETAALLHITPATVKSQASRTIARLRQTLAGQV